MRIGDRDARTDGRDGTTARGLSTPQLFARLHELVDGEGRQLLAELRRRHDVALDVGLAGLEHARRARSGELERCGQRG